MWQIEILLLGYLSNFCLYVFLSKSNLSTYFNFTDSTSAWRVLMISVSRFSLIKNMNCFELREENWRKKDIVFLFFHLFI